MLMLWKNAALALVSIGIALAATVAAQAQNYVGGYSQPAAIPSGVLPPAISDAAFLERYHGEETAAASPVQQPGTPQPAPTRHRLSRPHAHHKIAQPQ